MILSRWPYIFVGCVAFVLIVAGLITWRCCVARRKRKAARSAAVLLPDTARAPPRSPAAHQVSFTHLEGGQMEMRQSFSKAGPPPGYDGYRGSEYRTSFASSRTRV